MNSRQIANDITLAILNSGQIKYSGTVEKVGRNAGKLWAAVFKEVREAIKEAGERP